MTYADERRGRTYGTFVHCSAFAEAANRPYINILYANSLWNTDSWWIAFGCLPNICRTAECCFPHLGNTSTLNDGFVFAWRIRVPFVFRCKPSLKHIEKLPTGFYCWVKCPKFLIKRVNLIVVNVQSWSFIVCERNRLLKLIKKWKWRMVILSFSSNHVQPAQNIFECERIDRTATCSAHPTTASSEININTEF